MTLVSIASPKGGVGKTTLTANLAYALQRMGHQAVVIDFDSQNALRLHFGMALGDSRGYVADALGQRSWQEKVIEMPSGVGLLAYGTASVSQRQSFEAALRSDDAFLTKRLRGLLNVPGCVVLADLPPGPSAALDALGRLNALNIAVLLADSASLSLLPEIESGRFYAGHNDQRIFYVVNQVDLRSRLNREATEFFQARLGASLLGAVHRDEAVPEANASQSSVFQYAADSAVAYDIQDVASNISRLLPVPAMSSAMKKHSLV